jgi:hypothetical protein
MSGYADSYEGIRLVRGSLKFFIGEHEFNKPRAARECKYNRRQKQLGEGDVVMG